MAQTLYPDSLVTNSGFSSGAVGDVASDDGTTTDAGGNNDYIQYGFATPSGNSLVTGASSQSFTILAAKTGASGTNDATLEVALYDNGTLVSTLGTAVLTSTTNATHSFNWDGADVAGENVEIRVTQTDGGGGSPAKRAYVALDQVYWTADSFTSIETGEPISLAGQDNGLVNGTSFATHDAETSDDFTTITGSPARSTTVARGTNSYWLSGDSGTRNNLEFQETSWGTTSWMVVEYWFHYTGGLPSTTQQAYVEDTTGSSKIDIRFIDPELILRDAGGVDTAIADVSSVSAGNWYRVKFAWENNAGADSRARIELYNSSGTLLSSGSGVGDFSDGLGADNWLGFIGPGSDALELYIDDVEVFEDSDYIAPGPIFYDATVAAGSGDVDRTVNANTESATATPNASTVTADVDRDVSASTEQATGTTNASTVDLDVDLDVSAAVETASATTNVATVSADVDRDVSAATEVATGTAQSATVQGDVDRDVSAGAESATASTQAANVVREEDLELSANVSSATATTQAATVDLGSDLDVSATTSQAQATAAASDVSTDRGVAASTEQASATANAATVDASADRTVSCATESASATALSATVITSSDREVSATRASATASSLQATVEADADRTVSATRASATATTSPASVDTSSDRVVAATASAAQSTTPLSEVSRDRTVGSQTESVTALPIGSAVSKDLSIGALTESLRVSQAAAGVKLGAFSDAPTSRSFTANQVGPFNVGAGVSRSFEVTAPESRNATGSRSFTTSRKDPFNV